MSVQEEVKPLHEANAVRIPALFMHIQKTAGTTIIDLARKYYGSSNLTSHGDCMRRLPGEFAGVPFVSGHFGFHYASFLMGGRYSFTFLRDPAARILSLYYFCRSRDPGEYLLYKIARENDLDSFLRMATEHPSVRATIWNHQAWQLAHGFASQDSRSILKFSDNEILMLALNHLQKFDYIGFTETFEEDKGIVLRALGMAANTEPMKSNVTQGRPRLEELPSATRRLLDEVTQLDREVYEAACRHKRSKFR